MDDAFHFAFIILVYMYAYHSDLVCVNTQSLIS